MNKQPVEKKNRAFRNKWVWAFLGLFGTIFVVNYGFFSVAINTSPGLVNEEYYKYGLQQNKVDKQYRKQKARGWQVALTFDEQWHIHQPNVVTVTVTDRYGEPIHAGRVELTAYRPSDAKADIILELPEIKSGVYQSKLTLPIQGIWDMSLLFSKGEDKHMLNQRVIIQGNGEAEPSTLEKIVNYITP